MASRLECDFEGCEEFFRAHGVSIRYDARNAGWTTVNTGHPGVDYCPNHGLDKVRSSNSLPIWYTIKIKK